MATEEDIRWYCEQRPLVRPRINYMLALLLLFLYGASVRWLSHLLHGWMAGRGYDISPTLCHVAVELCFLLVFGRWIAIFCIRLYQRFAPEEVRRRCHCRPTCSEYAVIALHKYGLIRGSYKTYKRLKRCGRAYIDDAP